MSRFFFIATLIVAALIAIIVSAMNPERVAIELAFARIRTPLGVAFVVAFTVGLLAGLAWQLRWVAQLLAERGRLRRALRIAETKIRASEQAQQE